MTPAASALHAVAVDLARKAQSYRTPLAVEMEDALAVLDWPVARDWFAVHAARNSTEGTVVAECLEELTDEQLCQVFAGAFTPGAEPVVGRIVTEAIKRAVAKSIAKQANDIEPEEIPERIEVLVERMGLRA